MEVSGEGDAGLRTTRAARRSSVREALKKLQQLRLVEIQQGSGIRVCALEDASFDVVWDLVAQPGGLGGRWLEGLLDLREALFPGIVRLAMSRASPSELRDAAKKVQACVRGGGTDEEFVEQLRQLQTDLADLTRNPVLKIFSNALQRAVQETPLAQWVGKERRKITSFMQRIAVAVDDSRGDGARDAAVEPPRGCGPGSRLTGAAGRRHMSGASLPEVDPRESRTSSSGARAAHGSQCS